MHWRTWLPLTDILKIFPSFEQQKIQDYFSLTNFHVKQRYFWPASSLDATLNLQLELLQQLHSKTALCRCILLLHPSTPLFLLGLVNEGTFFHHHHLCYPFLFFYLPHLYVTFLLSAAHSALNHSVCKMCTFFFHLVLLQNEKKVRGFDMKLSYLPTTARLCSEPHAIWKRNMNEF